VIEGIGIDVIELKKVEHHSKNDAFMEKVFTQNEISFFKSRKNPTAHIATTFAAKEAVFKALGSGWIDGKEVEITRDNNNRPYVILKGNMEKLAKNIHIHISLSYNDSIAIAIALVESKNE
jgi:holo-[acyl-carrier protein] synthase